jgi:DNA-binding NtrC family response regulator
MGDESVSVLVVEDEDPIRALLEELLSPHCDCFTTSNANEAIALIESHFFNLILADIILPGMSGLELCRFVRKKSPRTVVVMISGVVDDQSVAEAMQAGAFDFITKPFNLADVKATVERALQHQASQA